MSENGNSSPISRDAFLAKLRESHDRFVIREIEGFGKVKIKVMTAGLIRETEKIESAVSKSIFAVQKAFVDEDGTPLFQSIQEVSDLPMPIFKLLSDVLTEVNKLPGLEEVAKN